MTNKNRPSEDPELDLTDVLRGVKGPIKKKTGIRSKPAPAAARAGAAASASAGASASRAAPEKRRNLAASLFGDGSASSLIPSGSGSRSTVSTPGPSRVLQSINLEDQRKLEQRDKRVERFAKSKDQWCSICKVRVTRGIDSFTEKSNWWHHVNGKPHKRSLGFRNVAWKTKCIYCPDKTFYGPEDWHKHQKSKGHRANKDSKSQFPGIGN